MKLNFQELLHSRRFYLILAGLVFVAVLPFMTGKYIISEVLTPIIIFALYASSWNLLACSGQGSLGHAAFLGIGGATSALLCGMGFPPVTALIVGSLLSAGIGFLIGIVCVRLKAWFLAMVTFGFSVIIVALLTQFDSTFQLVLGINGPVFFERGLPFYYFAFAITVISILAMFLVMKSKIGLAFKAVHNNELEAKMTGINTGKYRLIAFVLSTFFAGLAGGLFAEYMRYVDLSIFGADFSFLPLIMAVIGGLATIEGPVIGAGIIGLITFYLPDRIDPFLDSIAGPLFPNVSDAGPYLRLLFLGIFLIIMVIFAPKGVTALLRRLYGYLRGPLNRIYLKIRGAK